MCGPSKALKAINKQIQTFSNQVTDEAGTIFSATNKVFNNIVGTLDNIVKGGPSQAGFSEAENSARNAAVVQAGATEARNLKGAAASSVAAIGGGNVVAPAGSTQAAVFSADQKAAADTAAGVNQVQQENFATGRDNFFKAVEGEEKAPGMFDTSINANKEASDQQTEAQKSQQNIDTANNWWADDIMKLGSAALGGFTGGLGSSIGSSFMKSGGSGGSGQGG